MESKLPESNDLITQVTLEKLKKLADQSPVCLFTTLLDQQPLTTRPMTVRKVCDQGNFWFLSSIDSHKNIEVGVDQRVQLFFSNATDLDFMSVYGKGTIITDKEKVEELWNETEKTWFIEGVDEPTLSVIKVEPLDIECWDVKRGKMSSILKIDASEDEDSWNENNEQEKLLTS